MRLEKIRLRNLFVNAATLAGASVAFWGDPAEHPFRIVVTKGGTSHRFLVYIWNITHGGGRRATDEYRVQITGTGTVESFAGATTLLLGYYEPANVLAGWDAFPRIGTDLKSQSLQVRESGLLDANLHGIAVFPKSNHEVVICCSPSFLLEYAFTSTAMHGYTTTDVQEAVRDITRSEVDKALTDPVVPEDRKRVLRSQAILHREHDFRRRILAAYQNTCAVSGMQLRLLEAAHIVPVSVDGSHDGTTNGLCLDALYHRAFDQGLLVVMPDFRIALNMARVDDLTALNLTGGYERFIQGLRVVLELPASIADRPTTELLKRALTARNIDMNRIVPISNLRY